MDHISPLLQTPIHMLALEDLSTVCCPLLVFVFCQECLFLLCVAPVAVGLSPKYFGRLPLLGVVK